MNIALAITLLCISNVFMTYAWYGHLKDMKNAPWFQAVILSWLVAFFEYCFQVPANRIGKEQLSLVQLKTIQEVITLVIFVAYSYWYAGEGIRWNHFVGFLLIVGAVFFVFMDVGVKPEPAAPADVSADE